LDCFYRKLNGTSIGDQFNLRHYNECLYGINGENNNNSLYVCAIFQPLITVTTFNNTKIFEQGPNNYKFPLFGFEVNKHKLKRYAVPIIILVIVIVCLIVLCCYGMCRLCCPHMNTKMRKRQNSNSNMNCNTNTRMPQASAACNI